MKKLFAYATIATSIVVSPTVCMFKHTTTRLFHTTTACHRSYDARQVAFIQDQRTKLQNAITEKIENKNKCALLLDTTHNPEKCNQLRGLEEKTAQDIELLKEKDGKLASQEHHYKHVDLKCNFPKNPTPEDKKFIFANLLKASNLTIKGLESQLYFQQFGLKYPNTPKGQQCLEAFETNIIRIEQWQKELGSFEKLAKKVIDQLDKKD